MLCPYEQRNKINDSFFVTTTSPIRYEGVVLKRFLTVKIQVKHIGT